MYEPSWHIGVTIQDLEMSRLCVLASYLFEPKIEFGLIQKRGRQQLFVFTAKIFAVIRMTIGWQYPELQNVTDMADVYV